MQYVRRLTLALAAMIYGALLLSCAQSQQIDIRIRNTTGQPISIHARAGIFYRVIRLDADHEWVGWVPKMFVDSVDVEIRKAKVNRVGPR